MAKPPKEIRDEHNRNYIAAIEGFDGTELLFESGYKLTINLRVANVTADCPHGYSYEFNLFAPDPNGKPVVRILASDNAHAPSDRKHPHDHWHPTKWNPAGTFPIGVEDGKHVVVNSIEEHIGKFIDASRNVLIGMGLSSHLASMNTNPRRPPNVNETPER